MSPPEESSPQESTGATSPADGRTDGGTDVSADGRTDGGTDGRTDGGTDGRTDGRTDGGAQAPLRVTTLELFFDLVFAFTLTQLTAVLDAGLSVGPVSVRPVSVGPVSVGTVGVGTVGRVLLVFGLLWWMYEGYAWLTNAMPPVHAAERILLLVAIPGGFGRDGVLLGLGYLLVVVVHACLYFRVNANIVRVAPFNLASALLVTIAGLAGGAARYPLWVAALAIQLGSPLVVHPRNLFELRPAHLSERHSALLIVALGESVAAIGIGAAALAGLPAGAGARLVASAVLGLALAAALWWIIFGGDDEERVEQVLTAATSERRTSLALAALFYGNAPVLLGLVAMAAGVQQAIAHSGRPAAGDPAAAAVLAAGAALFLAGDAAIRRQLRTGSIRMRVAGAAAALATTAAGAFAGLNVQLALLTAILVAMLLAERRWAGAQAGTAG
jgi:low temperature requirement protein LtrA